MNRSTTRGYPQGTILLILALTALILPLSSLAAEEIPLTVDDAVSKAVSSDQRIISSYQKLQSSLLHTREIRRERYPSFSLNAGYTRLSHVSSSVNFGGASIDMESQDDLFTLSANLGYSLFDGFKRRETENLAALQVREGEITAGQMRQRVIFETRKAYWEAVRMENNVSMLEENLSLSEQNRDITKKKFNEGTVLKADLLAAEMRCDQARMDLEGAELDRDRASLNLQSLTGSLDTGTQEIPAFHLDSNPEMPPLEEIPGEEELLKTALNGRPEVQSALLALEQGETDERILKSGLTPTLSLTGNYTYANPNSRVFLQSEPGFTGTWSVGVSLSYDLGRLPSRLSAIASRDAEIESLKTEKDRQGELIALDVRNCLLTYRQTEKDIAHVSDMLSQAQENERVMKQRVRLGTASDVDQLSASLVRLQGEFAIINKQIDLQVAAADLIRAAAIGTDGE